MRDQHPPAASDHPGAPPPEAGEALPKLSAYMHTLGESAPPVSGGVLPTFLARHKDRFAGMTLGKWRYYFIAKLLMFGKGLIAFHVLPNLAFAAVILWTATLTFGKKTRAWLVGAAALVLFYYDSWLPPIERFFTRAFAISAFNFDYRVELVLRFIDFSVVGMLILAFGLSWLISRFFRMGVLIVLAMSGIGVLQQFPQLLHLKQISQPAENQTYSGADDISQALKAFFKEEATRVVYLKPPAENAVPFDLIFVQVCSLSWDDLRAVNLEAHPLWQQFDIVLTRFNSAASYSGPAAIHLLRATCGQQEHQKMYAPTEGHCYLMTSLQRSGFAPEFAINQTGQFDDFLAHLRKHGNLTMPLLGLDGVEVAMTSFYGSPVNDDYALLNRWLTTRQNSANTRVAFFYNTVSLHDGNHLPGTDALPNSLKTYKARLSRFLDSIARFIDDTQRSGRRAVLVMVPEHGASLRGDQRQIAGLRDIPTPNIALVPVGIKVIGGRRKGNTASVDEPTSYLAISHIIRQMLEKSPYQYGAFTASSYVADLPTTPFVAQNEEMTVMEQQSRYYLSRNSGEKWESYDEFNSGKPDRAP